MFAKAAYRRPPFRQRWRRNWAAYKYVYLMLVPILAYYIIFHYIPMLGSVIAFQNFKPALGIAKPLQTDTAKASMLSPIAKISNSTYPIQVVLRTLNGLDYISPCYKSQ